MTTARDGWLPRALGFAGSLYPLSLVALVLMRRGGPRLCADDWPWIGSLMAYLALSVIHGTFDTNVLGVALAWMVFRSAARLRSHEALLRRFGAGFAIGVVGLAILAVVDVLVLDRPRAMGPPWFGDPNVLGHSVLIMGLGVAAVSSKGRLRVASLAATIVILLLTGSRSAIVGLLVGLAVAFVIDQRARVRIALVTTGMTVVLLVITLLLPTSPWAQRVLGPFANDFARAQEVNLIVASEALANPSAWNPGGVQVRTSAASERGAPAEHTMERTTAADWARPQQLVRLEADAWYTISGEFSVSEQSAPGFLGWATTDTGVLELRVAVRDGAPLILSERGFRDTQARVVTLDDGWERLEVTARLDGRDAAALAFGPSPDLTSSAPGARAQVRALQVERGVSATAYEPTTRIRVGAGEALSRGPIWVAALEAVQERPISGWGRTPFASYFSTSGRASIGSDTPTHAHNQVLATAFEGGALGVAALGLLVWGLVRACRGWPLAVMLGLFATNLFDATLLAGVILLPAAVLSGFTTARRSATSRTPVEEKG